MNQETKQTVVFVLCLALAVVSLGYFYWTRKDRELDMVKGGKKWMLGEMIYGFGNVVQFGNLFLQVGLSTIHFKGFLHNIWFDLIFSFVWVSFCIITYIAMVVIPRKAEELLAKTYPEYKIS